MVAHTRAPSGHRRIRPLNRPRPLRVEAGEKGWPTAVYLSARRWAVEAMLETWRIDDEWWRKRPISRLYFSLLLEDGRVLTVFQDAMSGRWAMQAY